MALRKIKRKIRRGVRRLMEYKRKVFASGIKDYSLHSGERQVGANLDEIRSDHLARYETAISDITSLRHTFASGLILDVFCGNGYGTRMLSELNNVCVWGIDGSSQAVVHAEQYFSSKNNYFSHKIFPFTLPQAIADVAVSMESIEHTEHHDLFFQTLVNAVRPGGVIYLSAPNEQQMPFNRTSFSFHYRHFTVGDIETLANKHGAVVERWWCQNVYRNRANPTGTLRALDQTPVVDGQNGQWLIARLRRN